MSLSTVGGEATAAMEAVKLALSLASLILVLSYTTKCITLSLGLYDKGKRAWQALPGKKTMYESSSIR